MPEEAKRQIFKWMIYDIKEAGGKGQPINVVAIREAFVIIFCYRNRFCNKRWNKFIGPHWIDLDGEVGAIIMEEIRGAIYNVAVMPLLKWL